MCFLRISLFARCLSLLSPDRLFLAIVSHNFYYTGVVDEATPTQELQSRIHIDTGEEVILETRPHFLLVLPALLLVLLGAIAATLFIFSYPWVPAIVKIGLILLLVIAIVNFVARYLQWKSIEFIVTPRRVFYCSGVLSVRSAEVPLERISEIKTSANLFERTVGIGSLRISSSGDDSEIDQRMLPNPSGVRNAINRAAEVRRKSIDAQKTLPTTVIQSAPASPIEQIAQLGDLFGKGLVTRDEFESAKAELLKRI